MKGIGKKLLAAGLISCLCIPASVLAADNDLQTRIDRLTKELEELRNLVRKTEVASKDSAKKAEDSAKKAEDSAKKVEEVKDSIKKVEGITIGKWLTIGGDYRFRYDFLNGRTLPFTDASATFANAQNTMMSNFFSATASGAPVGGFTAAQWAGNIAAMTQFSKDMAAVKTYAQANTFLGANAGLLGALNNFAVQVPAYRPENVSLYTNRFGLDLHAKATQDVTVNARLAMYKVFGSQDETAITNGGSAPFFADRTGVFDGTLGHIPSNSYLDVDRAYATWSNIMDQPLWFSIGRRPSTNGAPSNLRLNNERPGNGGTPSLLVDYAFDGMTIGYAPDIEALPGAYAKVCYGRGFDSGFRVTPGNSIEDTDMLGVAVIPVDTDPLRVWLQWNRGMNIFDFPTMKNTYFGNTAPKANLGDIDWYGAGFMSTVKNIGPGKLNFFSDFGLSVTHPNSNVSAQAGFQGLLTGGFFNPEAAKDKTGWAIYAGVRYDLPTKTKIGFEFNHGSKNWITFAPAADDLWTSKVGTRGNVFEPYVIQELDLKPISSYFSKVFFRVGYQYYDFEYTGSNNWVGAPVKISEARNQMMLLTPLEYAHDLYATFEVKF